jgi:hypothetical protein
MAPGAPDSGALLEDYLGRPDFGKALRELTGGLGDELALPERVDEIGVVCPNIRMAAEQLQRRWPTMRTFLLGEGSPSVFVDHGRDVPFTTRVGFGFYEGVILELTEPGIGSDIFGQTPNPKGQIVINHLGFLARGPTHVRQDGGIERAWAPVLREHRVLQRVDAVINLLGIRAHVYIYETVQRTRDINLEFLDFRLFAEHGPQIAFPASLSGMIGWLQAHVGPRFIHLPARQQLPEAPVPRM